MKVVSAKQMGAIESQAYRNGSREEDFMEDAGRGIAEWIAFFTEKENFPHTLYLLCGKGNNAGDAYVAASYLLEQGYSVLAYSVAPIEDCSELCQKNQQRFASLGGRYHELTHIEEELKFPEEGIIIDALFGTGFHGTAKDPYASVIKHANRSGLPILAVDIPSGLNGETGVVEGPAITATETIFLGLPKTGFFLQDGWNHVGKLRYVDFGLPQSYIEESDCDFVLIYPPLVKPYMPRIVRNRHKYQAGYVVGLAGSPGMPGAALLASNGALRGGAGMVKLLHPQGMEDELSASPYELIKVPYSHDNLTSVIDLLNEATATYVGPGLGRDKQARELLKEVLPQLEKPTVIDADALTIIAEEKIRLPKETILTPHAGEMMRLLNHSAPKPGTREFLETCQQYAEDRGVTLVLKGGPSYVFHPEETIHVTPYGDPGMATAGSGDVLTGLLASLLAQGVKCREAAALGVYLHGFAGEDAVELKTSYCLIATDIIDHFPSAFWTLS